jgi:hypothetical protein
MSHTTISDNEGATGHSSPFIGDNPTQTHTEEGNMVFKYRKMLETLDERRKKRNEERERKRMQDPTGGISEDEPDDITPFLEHPNGSGVGQESQQTHTTPPVKESYKRWTNEHTC